MDYVFFPTMRPSLLLFALGLAASFFNVSCETLPLNQRQYISQPCMSFDGTGANKFECGLTGQIETGRATSGGAAGGGCASCH